MGFIKLLGLRRASGEQAFPVKTRKYGTCAIFAPMHRESLHQQLALYHVYYHFCLPHASLRLPLPQSAPTHGNGSATRWQPHTPAMAAGLPDHVWTLREVLLFCVPPWPQPAGL